MSQALELEGSHAYIYNVLVGICFLVFLGTCAGHMWYRIQARTTTTRGGRVVSSVAEIQDQSQRGGEEVAAEALVELVANAD